MGTCQSSQSIKKEREEKIKKKEKEKENEKQKSCTSCYERIVRRICSWTPGTSLDLSDGKFSFCESSKIKLLQNPLPFHLLDGIIELNIGGNYLDLLPDNLPKSLEVLECYSCELTSLSSSLPPGLKTIRCHYNKIESLPETLPDTLESIICYRNRISSLPSHLPSALKELQLQYNRIGVIPPELLPLGLEELWIVGCDLTILPNINHLPLKKLHCDRNELETLPTLPSTLIVLSCSRNPLKKLPALPRSLEELDCSASTLTQIPPIPSTLTKLYCHDCNLETLPDLPPQSQLDDNFLAVRNKFIIPHEMCRVSVTYCPRPIPAPAPIFISILRKEEEIASKSRTETRTSILKEELVAASWSPRRIEKLLDSGLSLEEIIG